MPEAPPSRPTAPDPAPPSMPELVVELIAALVAVTEGVPRILTIHDGAALPSGPFVTAHRSLQSGLRAQVERQTHHPLGYLEQLYTFADGDRLLGDAQRVISISYLGLTREGEASGDGAAGWRGWYRYFPWEDWRDGPPACMPALLAALRRWAQAAEGPAPRRQRRQRLAAAFGLDEAGWNDELVLQRYELLFEAGLVPEATRPGEEAPWQAPGEPMAHDHRRILATAIARLRAKIRYRPIVFELMPERFTLLQLQRSVEALAGQKLHKQNFRRLMEQQALVEETGESTAETGGRPARLFRFRRAVLAERAAAGSKLPLARS
ncbi:NUDIX hydrolase [Pseudoroseomonas cervicalis]|uniref:NUDIX hydrolase n=1 Tax=Teichococcus cervicalis TaxID=204525 RepID=UPI0038CFB7E8